VDQRLGHHGLADDLHCAVLVVTLPTTTVLTGLAVFAVGLGYRLVRLRLART